VTLLKLRKLLKLLIELTVELLRIAKNQKPRRFLGGAFMSSMSSRNMGQLASHSLANRHD